jgi:hypothetical protein
MNQHDPALLASRLPYQHGYVTNDAQRAIGHFGQQLGITKFAVRDMTLTPVSPRGPLTIRCLIGFAYLDGVMIEVIEPVSGDAELYTSALPASGFAIVLHHLAYLVDEAADWQAFRDRVDPAALVFESPRSSLGSLSYLYVDTRDQLGHHLEYMQIAPERLATLRAQIPAN